MNRGRCIKLVNNIASIQKTIKKFYDGIHKDFKYSDEDENKYSQSMFKKLKSKDEGKICFYKISKKILNKKELDRLGPI